MSSPLSIYEHRRDAWDLDPDVVFLNHGSYGACPRAVLERQRELQDRIEREPVRFFVREYTGLLDEARDALAAFVGAQPADLVYVRNATSAVNAVLASLAFEPGDELLTTDHAYNACRNALDLAAERSGARVVVADVPYPCASPSDAVDAIVSKVTDRTRIALVDHVTSATGVVMPIEKIVGELAARGVDTLVDGAHGVGMLPLALDDLGAAYYTSNCHKWLCTPKGSAFLHVRADRRDAIRPQVISHGANAPADPTHSRFQQEFDWIGTDDPTPWLVTPFAIDTLASLVDGGWPAIRARNHALTLAARDVLCDALQVKPPIPDAMLGSLATVPLPIETSEPLPPRTTDPIQDALFANHGIEVPITPWKGGRLVRISSQLHNALADTERLADALAAEGLGRGTRALRKQAR